LYSSRYSYLKPFAEIPDEKSNVKRNIQKSLNYNNLHKHPTRMGIRINNCTSTNRQTNGQINENCYTYIYISFRCNSDSQYLSNKCIDGYCIFNDKDPSEFCTDIYSNTLFFGRHSYRHCGKAIGDSCKKNKECGSKKCWNNFGYSHCAVPNRPSDSDFISTILIFISCYNYIYFLYF